MFMRRLYSLISLQTMSGYNGHYYGISRMNRGYGSRPFVSLIYPGPFGQRWRRDVEKLIALYPTLTKAPWPYSNDGTILTWTEEWDGQSSLPLGGLNPFFIEVARIIRLKEKSSGISALAIVNKTMRIAAKAQKGVLGDPWIPINKQNKEVSALTVSATGLTPKLLSSLLFQNDFEPAAMQQADPERKGDPAIFYVTVMVRGKKTEGFHSKSIPVPGEVISLLGRPTERDQLERMSKTGLNDAQAMQNKILKPALFSLLEGGPEKLDFGKTEVGSWVDKALRSFSASWGTDYFDWLWRTLDEPNEDKARLAWLSALKDKARRVLEESMTQLPEHHGRHYRARVNAQGMFFGSLYKNFPELKEQKDATPAN